MSTTTTNIGLTEYDYDGTEKSTSGEDILNAINNSENANSGFKKIDAAVGARAKKVDNATTGNFAGLDADGDLTDSGKKASDFISSANGSVGNANIANGTISNAKLKSIAANRIKGNNSNSSSAPKDLTVAEVMTMLNAEDMSNKVTSISSNSTDTQYPSAKCVYDGLGIKADFLAAAKSYYVDGANGNDANDGLSAATAKKTIQAALDAIPKVGAGEATVNIAQGTYAEVPRLYGHTVGVRFNFNSSTIAGMRLLNCQLVTIAGTPTFQYMADVSGYSAWGPSQVNLVELAASNVSLSSNVTINGVTAASVYAGIIIRYGASLSSATSGTTITITNTTLGAMIALSTAYFGTLNCDATTITGLRASSGAVVAYASYPGAAPIVTATGGRVYTGSQA